MIYKNLFNKLLVLCLSVFAIDAQKVTEPKLPVACLERYNAVFSTPEDDGIIYMLVEDEDLWSYDRNSLKWYRVNLNEVFPEIQKGVRGASSDDGLLWFFKGKTVWAYSNFELINGFPKNIKDSKYPSEPESAINIGGKFYLIRENFAYEFDTNTLTVKNKVNLLSILINVASVLTPNVKLEIDAIYNDDGQYYIFSEDNVYKLDRSILKSILSPKKRTEVWFPCFSNTPTSTKLTTRTTTKPTTTTKSLKPTTKSNKKTTTTESPSTTNDLVETTETTTDIDDTTENDETTRKTNPTRPIKTTRGKITTRTTKATLPSRRTTTTKPIRPTRTKTTTTSLETTDITDEIAETTETPETTMETEPTKTTLLTRPVYPYPTSITTTTTATPSTTKEPECHSKEKHKHKHHKGKCSKEKKKHSKEKKKHSKEKHHHKKP